MGRSHSASCLQVQPFWFCYRVSTTVSFLNAGSDRRQDPMKYHLTKGACWLREDATIVADAPRMTAMMRF
jgi:hypothetical protein